MKPRLAVLLLALGSAACASRSGVPTAPASVTILGERGRLETWEARALAHGHLHAKGEDGTCPAMAAFFRTSAAAAELGGRRGAEVQELAEKFAAALEGMCVALFGRGYGGTDLLAMGLRPSPESPEALFVVVPALGSGESERTFRPPQLLAEFLSPLDRVEAALESGRVRVTRLPHGGFDVELFLVLRPAGPAAYERLQVVSRLETPPPR
jgi:hypothetical protein